MDILNEIEKKNFYTNIDFMKMTEKQFDLVYEHCFIIPLLKYQINGDSEGVRSHFDKLMRENRWRYAQRLYYCMAYILDKVDEKAFLQQPCSDELEGDLILCKAIKADLKNENASALYETYLQFPQHKRAVNPVLDQFVNLQIKGKTRENRK